MATQDVLDVVSADSLRLSVSGLVRVAGVATASASRVGGWAWWGGIAWLLTWLDGATSVGVAVVQSDEPRYPFAVITRLSDGADLASAIVAAGLDLGERPRRVPVVGGRYPLPVWPAPSGVVACPTSGGWSAGQLTVTLRGCTGAAAGLDQVVTLRRIGVQRWYRLGSSYAWTLQCGAGAMLLSLSPLAGGFSGDWYLPLPSDFDPRGLYQSRQAYTDAPLRDACPVVLDGPA